MDPPLTPPRAAGSGVRRAFTIERLRSLLATDGVFWRHDVDADLGAAVQLAKLERRLGVVATYYLMPRSVYYNLFSAEGHEAVQALQSAGHRFALHCDLRVERTTDLADSDVSTAVEADFSLLEAEYPGRFMRSVSFHVPPDCVLWRDFDGFDNAYASRWHGRYLSDSRRVFAFGDPEDHAERPIQINLHPEHWMRDGGDWLAARRRAEVRRYVRFFREEPELVAPPRPA